MPKYYNPANNPAQYRYKKEALKRIPLDVQRADYDRIKAAADVAGLPVNAWIKSILFAALDASGAGPGSAAAPAPGVAPAGAAAGDGSTVGGSGDASGAAPAAGDG